MILAIPQTTTIAEKISNISLIAGKSVIKKSRSHQKDP
jgi:hypothetical protein